MLATAPSVQFPRLQDSRRVEPSARHVPHPLANQRLQPHHTPGVERTAASNKTGVEVTDGGGGGEEDTAA